MFGVFYHKQIIIDVNNDKKITASDLTELRKLILGITNNFSNNNAFVNTQKQLEDLNEEYLNITKVFSYVFGRYFIIINK